MTAIEYRVKALRSEWRGFDKARLDISVGQPYHEGAKLQALVGWVRERFQAATVNVCDTLQCYNLQFQGMDRPAAIAETRRLGDAWLHRAGPVIAALPQLSISRWESWKNHADYLPALERTLRLYDGCAAFRGTVDEGVAGAWERKRGQPGYEDARLADFERLSRQFVLEEVAVGMVMAKDRVADIYPGSYLKVWDVLREAGEPALQSLTRVDFKRRKTPDPPNNMHSHGLRV